MFLPVRWLIIENCVRCMKYDASIGFLYNVRSSHHTQTTVNTITIPSHAYHLVRAWPRTPRLQDVLLYMSVSHFAGCRLRVRGAAACSVGQLWRRPPTPLSCLPLPRPPRIRLALGCGRAHWPQVVLSWRHMPICSLSWTIMSLLQPLSARNLPRGGAGEEVGNECGTGGYRDR